MIYKYCAKSLLFKKVKLKTIFLSLISLILLFFLVGKASYYIGINSKTELKEMTRYERVLLINENDTFEKEKLIEMMKDLNIRYAYIPIAQSILETGHWKSDIFIENHNLFGMKQARSRITTSKGTKKSHAYYETWRESVYDYAFYQARYLNKIKSEADYFKYLSASYAEDPDYINKVKLVIQHEKLKELFK